MITPSSNREWIFWGRKDPLYAVAVFEGRQIGGAASWSSTEFLEFGRVYFQDVYQQWAQYGVGSQHCVEIGCGSGRITCQLSRHFQRVTAIDVAEGQIETAAALLRPHASNVEFKLVSQTAIPIADGSCDAVFSCEVFQHFDDHRPISEYCGEAYRALRSGGTMCFQLPVQGLQPLTFTSSALRNRILRLLRRLGRRRMMIYRLYEADLILDVLRQRGFQDLEVRFFQAKPQDGFHAYFFARKP